MRIISQDKWSDINYDNNDIELRHNKIFLTKKSLNSEILWLGGYSTFEKALKVMEMIREEYIGKFNKILVTEEEGKIEEVIKMNYYFYMPKDEDVE